MGLPEEMRMMAVNRADIQPQQDPTSEQQHGVRPVQPRVTNANRVVVGFPFSTITMEDTANTAALAGLVARLCRLLAESAPAEALADLATEAEELAARLRA